MDVTNDSSEGVRTRLWRSGRLEREGFDLEEVSDHLQDEGALVWLDLCQPDHALLLKLADEFQLKVICSTPFMFGSCSIAGSTK